MEVKVQITPEQLCEYAAPTPAEFAKQLQDTWGNFFNEIDDGARRILIDTVVACQKRNIVTGNLRG